MLFGCQSDDNGPQEPELQPTVFQGRVLYEDNNEPVSNALLTIAAYEGLLLSGNKILENFDITLDDNAQGLFNIMFQPNPDIDDFGLSVIFFDGNDLIIDAVGSGNGIICSPTDCFDFVQGFEYTDLTILVPRPETN